MCVVCLTKEECIGCICECCLEFGRLQRLQLLRERVQRRLQQRRQHSLELSERCLQGDKLRHGLCGRLFSRQLGIAVGIRTAARGGGGALECAHSGLRRCEEGGGAEGRRRKERA